MKQKSFYERVRCYEDEITPIDELMLVIQNLSDEKISILLKLAKSI
jgi:hypothetical protein